MDLCRLTQQHKCHSPRSAPSTLNPKSWASTTCCAHTSYDQILGYRCCYVRWNRITKSTSKAIEGDNQLCSQAAAHDGSGTVNRKVMSREYTSRTPFREGVLCNLPGLAGHLLAALTHRVGADRLRECIGDLEPENDTQICCLLEPRP